MLQFDIACRKQPGKFLARQKRIFPFALVRHVIDGNQHVVDEAGMAHHKTAVRQAIEKAFQRFAEVAAAHHVIGPGKSWIEDDPGAGIQPGRDDQ